MKSRAGRRVITLPQPLVDALRAHRTAQLEEPIGHKRDHADWKALLVDADVRDARLHDARHTAASMLLLLKVPGRVVMDILGHSSYQLTMNTYSLVAPELNSEAAQLMAGALWDEDGAEPSAPVRRRSQ